jgi:hypothetical protein
LPKYIIRLDDACPTMDSQKWDLFETFLDNYNIKPIVAVIPNNLDNSMLYDEEDRNFWKKVKRWQDKGWHIALHGYDHKYITDGQGLVPLNKQSEFVGLPLEEQIEKIKNGWKIFKDNDIESDIWVAPSHTFDENTLKAIKSETTISVVSDGISKQPFSKFGFFWIPQQLWKYKKISSGIYTICYHPSMMSEAQIYSELKVLNKNNNTIISNIEALKEKHQGGRLSLIDYMYKKYFFIKRNFIKKVFKLVRK